jgi:hypothetical protein
MRSVYYVRPDSQIRTIVVLENLTNTLAKLTLIFAKYPRHRNIAVFSIM